MQLIIQTWNVVLYTLAKLQKQFLLFSLPEIAILFLFFIFLWPRQKNLAKSQQQKISEVDSLQCACYRQSSGLTYRGYPSFFGAQNVRNVFLFSLWIELFVLGCFPFQKFMAKTANLNSNKKIYLHHSKIKRSNHIDRLF